MRHRYLILLGLLFSCALLGIKPAFTHALTVSPPRKELSANPGATIRGEFKLINEERESKTVYFSTRNFEAKDESGTPDFPTKKTNLATWISLQTSATIGPKQELRIPYLINIPAGVEPAGYFAVIFTSSQPPNETEDGQVALATDLGTLVLLRVNGELEEGADILEFNTANKKHWLTSLPVDFMIRFQNTGDSWVKPLGDIVIQNMWGKTAKIVPANSDGSNVLPRSIRRLEASWLTKNGETEDPAAQRPMNLPEGFWNKVIHEWKYSPIGRYTARVTLTYGPEQTKSQSTISFWIIPWHLLSVAIPSLVLLLVLLRLIIKRYNKYIVRRAVKQRSRE